MERMNLVLEEAVVEGKSEPTSEMLEQAFMQGLIQFLEIDNLPVRPSTQFGKYLGEHPSMFGEEVAWFEAKDISGHISLVECEPLLRKLRFSEEEIVSFEGLRVCLSSTGHRKAFIVTYHGLLFLLSESTGFNVKFDENKVTIVNNKNGLNYSFDLK